MSSTGMIFRESRQLATLPKDWVPVPLGSRLEVTEIVDGIMRTPTSGSLALTLTIESEEGSVEPRIISVSGVWGEAEMGVVRALCLALEARFYDAETADFIEL